jgi:hypothetical protein
MAAYGTLDAAKAYHLARGNTAFAAATDARLGECLLLGSEYVDARYRGSFAGIKVGGRAQVREWPRNGAYDNIGNAIAIDEIPREAEEASYEAALQEVTTAGSLAPVVTMATQIKRERIEGIIDTEYLGATNADAVRPVMTKVDEVIDPILIQSAGSSFIGTAQRGA